MSSVVWDYWFKMTAVGSVASVVATDFSVENLATSEAVKLVAINVLKTSGASLAGAAVGVTIGYFGGRYIVRAVNSVIPDNNLLEAVGEGPGAFLGFFSGSAAGMYYVISDIANS